jgi:two-component system heavy metal sensor histidine kinase CusS
MRSFSRLALKFLNSLAWRLTAWYAISSFALVLLIATLSYFALLNSCSLELDTYLDDTAAQLIGTLRSGPDAEATLKSEIERELSLRGYVKNYARVLDENGVVRFESSGMTGVLPVSAFPVAQVWDVRKASDIPVDRHGHAYRALAVRTLGPHVMTVQIACDRKREAEILRRYQRFCITVLCIAFVLCVAGGFALARRGIRPLERITAAANCIGYDTLRDRIPDERLPEELRQLATAVNEMLNRLQTSFSQVSQFSEDIAHELRTPVTNLRGELEVVLGKPRTADEYRDALGSALEECERLTRLVDNLLFIARSENAGGRLERDRVNLSEELSRTCEFFSVTAEDAGVALSWDAPATLSVAANRDLLRSLIGNLVDNALAHTPRGGRVTAQALQQDGQVLVRISDTGKGIPPEHLAHIFERFYRVDRSRAKNSGGVGLGLAIVKSIANLHGATVDIQSAVGLGTTITARFSAATPPTPSRSEAPTLRYFSAGE